MVLTAELSSRVSRLSQSDGGNRLFTEAEATTLICLVSSRRPNVHRGLGNGRQGLVGLLLLLQGLIQLPDRPHAEPGSPSLQSSVAGDFDVSHRLRRGDANWCRSASHPRVSRS